jgi:hypothetical protein
VQQHKIVINRLKNYINILHYEHKNIIKNPFFFFFFWCCRLMLTRTCKSAAIHVQY